MKPLSVLFSFAAVIALSPLALHGGAASGETGPMKLPPGTPDFEVREVVLARPDFEEPVEILVFFDHTERLMWRLEDPSDMERDGAPRILGWRGSDAGRLALSYRGAALELPVERLSVESARVAATVFPLSDAEAVLDPESELNVEAGERMLESVRRRAARDAAARTGDK